MKKSTLRSIIKEVLNEEFGPTKINAFIVNLSKGWKDVAKKKIGNSYYLLMNDLKWTNFPKEYVVELKRLKVPSVFSVIILVGPSKKARVQYFKSSDNAKYSFENNI